MTSSAITTVTQILKKISASERKTSGESLPEYKPMPKVDFSSLFPISPYYPNDRIIFNFSSWNVGTLSDSKESHLYHGLKWRSTSL